jgi:hypothetical protein
MFTPPPYSYFVLGYQKHQRFVLILSDIKFHFFPACLIVLHSDHQLHLVSSLLPHFLHLLTTPLPPPPPASSAPPSHQLHSQVSPSRISPPILTLRFICDFLLRLPFLSSSFKYHNSPQYQNACLTGTICRHCGLLPRQLIPRCTHPPIPSRSVCNPQTPPFRLHD